MIGRAAVVSTVLSALRCEGRQCPTGDLRDRGPPVGLPGPFGNLPRSHAARTFLNSLAFQKRVFDFEPSDEITLLLTDFSDTGNAGASVVPRNTVTVEIAPLNFAFETIAGNERMNIIMNHELVHVATMDQAARGTGSSASCLAGR